MNIVGHALAWNFFDFDGRPRQLRFPRHRAPAASPEILSSTGQLVALIADARRTEDEATVVISRPGIRYTDVEQAIDGWQNWAAITGDTIDLLQIRRRICTAGLD